MDATSSSPSADDWLAPDPEPAPVAAEAAPRRSRTGWVKGGSLLAAGVIAGSAVVLATGHGASGATAATTGRGVPNAPPGGRLGTGGLDGEQRVQGTLTAVGPSTVTVTTSAGTRTYQVTSQTQIVKDGTAATLGQLTMGQQVLVHVYRATSGGQMLVERLFAGTLPDFGGPGGGSSGGGTTTT